MYDYEYENDVLLFLRLLKFLHTEYPFVLEQIIKDYPTADEEDIWMILDELLMAVFDEGAPDEGDDMMTVRFSDERIDRLYTQGCKHSPSCSPTPVPRRRRGRGCSSCRDRQSEICRSDYRNRCRTQHLRKRSRRRCDPADRFRNMSCTY